MFVRWKRRRLCRMPRWAKPEYVRYAILAESARVDGKPRQKMICYLSYIKEKCLSETSHRELFWIRVDAHFSELGLEPTVQANLEDSLLTVVARPATAELAQLAKERARLG